MINQKAKKAGQKSTKVSRVIFNVLDSRFPRMIFKQHFLSTFERCLPLARWSAPSLSTAPTRSGSRSGPRRRNLIEPPKNEIKGKDVVWRGDKYLISELLCEAKNFMLTFR